MGGCGSGFECADCPLAVAYATHLLSWPKDVLQSSRHFEPFSRPTSSCYYHLPLPLTARPSVDCRDRYPTPNSNFTGAHRLVHPYGSPTILWLSMVLSLYGSLHPLAPHRGGRSVSAAPSSLPLFLHKAVVSRTPIYPFIHLWVFTLFTQSRHGSLSAFQNSEIIPRLLHAFRSRLIPNLSFCALPPPARLC